MAIFEGKILEVNLTDGSIGSSTVDKDTIRKYIGGSGLSAKLFYDRVSLDVDPLSGDNLMVVMTGPLGGTAMPGGSRFSVCAKSPQTNMLGESSCGGTFAAWLRSAGYDGIAIKGASSKPVCLVIQDGKAEIQDATNLWGKGTYDTIDTLREKNGGKTKASILSIGQAGENLVKYAAIANEKRDFIGRTGMGAVMGSKKLKAIVAIGTGKVEAAVPDKFNEIRKQFTENAKGHFITDIVKAGGTNGALDIGAMIGDLPGKNWVIGDMSAYGPKVGGGVLNSEQFLTGTDMCHGCLVNCKRVVKKENGDYPLKSTAGPEYEGVASFGPLLMIDDMAAIIKMNEMCNDYGMDVISCGATIAMAMDCVEQGIIGAGDAGVDLKWGGADAVIKMIDMIGNREGFGDTLAEGSRIAAQKIGGNAANYAVQIKGLEVPMHDPRAFHSMGLSYATNVRGACHTSDMNYSAEQGIFVWPEIGINGGYEQKSSIGKAELTIIAQNMGQVMNSLPICYLLMSIISSAEMVELTNAAGGFDYTLEELMTCGERAWMLKRGMNNLMGITAADDTLPKQILTATPDGAIAGSAPDLDLMMKEFYEIRKLESNGRPSKEKLESLGLGDLAAKL